MNIQLHTACRAALVAALMAAPAAQSQMYRWVDAHGSVTYSNKLPSDTSGVRDLTVVLDVPSTVSSSPADKRSPAAAGSGPSLVEPPQASPRIAVSPNAPEAVRDPCLRSADPKCIERNKAAYVPGRGYSPAAAVGATSSAPAGGTLAGGSVTPPPKLTPPKASDYALPPGSESPRKR